MENQSEFIQRVQRIHWDAVVVGTGMGGSATGYVLTKAGLRVLFLEKGYNRFSNSAALIGKYAEEFSPTETSSDKRAEFLRRAGRWAEPIQDISQAKRNQFTPFIGSGSGGSTALYGMALERMFPIDFQPLVDLPPQAELLSEGWPIRYETLVPHYETMEALFQVNGTVDPLRDDRHSFAYIPPAGLSPANREMYELFQKKGLHPYRIPQARAIETECNHCQGYLCEHRCKRDADSVFLQPAIIRYGAEILDQCEVVRLVSNKSGVREVYALYQDQPLRIKAKVFVLAAGALATPCILLRSHSGYWPNGLANRSDQVGRNLMRHFIDLYAVKTNQKEEVPGNTKEIALNDFYSMDGQKFGTLQSFGQLPPSTVSVKYLGEEIRKNYGAGALEIYKPAKGVLRKFLDRLFRRRIILASIMEDFPRSDNRVLPNDGIERSRKGIKINFRYRVNQDDKERIRMFRKRITEVLRPFRFMLLNEAEKNERLAHACGTCRFGNNPRTSVLNADNRAHEVDNLYVMDASFFPSSGGTNPALTIGANALRAAGNLLRDQFGKHSEDSKVNIDGNRRADSSRRLVGTRM